MSKVPSKIPKRKKKSKSNNNKTFESLKYFEKFIA